ncbi:selenium-dependent molybdenum hydroxylase system protein, YqeB family [Coprococcus comes ATCC 27758]|uniref:Selenium-dependent molybdenum hydroxylase system protein, YqeB family n=1 Tax=Coprococcus comes ATCC 27758 TaxID=470146 RepID=C0BBS1_9FIRM|nr:selenium-dependent molybdenum hydroxylase system protein, YqeB family [Coprococcus comes ATCC 27758]
MKILIRGAGDLATGIAAELWERGHQILMTDVAIPLTVRREVAFSRAVYEEHAVVEGIEAVLADNFEEAETIMATRKIAVMVDEKAEVRKEYLPDVLVDGIMAKKNLGTRISDAPLVIGIGPGFTAAGDCHFVIETQRGEHLGEVIREGSAIPNTGIPGNIGGYTVERLLKASADGIMHPVARIGDVVKKGQIVARCGDEPVYARLHGIVRGMLQEGVPVKKGLKIGDVDARIEGNFVIRFRIKHERSETELRKQSILSIKQNKKVVWTTYLSILFMVKYKKAWAEYLPQ